MGTQYLISIILNDRLNRRPKVVFGLAGENELAGWGQVGVEGIVGGIEGFDVFGISETIFDDVAAHVTTGFFGVEADDAIGAFAVFLEHRGDDAAF